MSRIPDETTPGAVHLTVADLERSASYYREAIGLRELAREDGRAALGAGERELVVLYEEPGARPAPGTTGLFHLALLVPERADLARWLTHALEAGTPLTGASDHDVSEALYLRDPDRHGIEIYADRPRDLWEGEVAARLTTRPLDVDDLLREAGGDGAYAGLPDGTTMGHVHLKVADLASTAAFYGGLLGMDVTAEIPGAAVFLAAGGYHHHVAGNVWESAGGNPAPPGSAALRHATLVLPDERGRDKTLARLRAAGHEAEASPDGPLVRDPSGNALVLAVARVQDSPGRETMAP